MLELKIINTNRFIVMKKYKVFLVCLVAIGFFGSCKDQATTVSSEPISIVGEEVEVYKELNPGGILLDFDAESPIATYYVSEDDVPYFQGPSVDSKVLGKYGKGIELDVLEISGDWLVVRERISRDVVEEGKEINRTAWEKVFVPKGKASKNPFVKVEDNELYSTTNTDYNTHPSTLFDMGWLSKKEFEKASKQHVSAFKADTLKFVQENKVYKLEFDSCERLLEDNISESDDYSRYEYKGTFEKLNREVFYVGLYEAWNYIMIDREDCSIENDWNFLDMPVLSPKGTRFATIGYDPYMDETNVQLIPLKNGKLGESINVSIEKWTIWETERYKMFWVDENTFYVPILHVRTLSNTRNVIEDKEAEKHLQFIFCTLKKA
ncbi:hypothetical protein SAMN04487893_102257 [Myroides guanonis]|uniref:SH3 domain-containing protein n=2 Tax=Myroides guanonis TaxID=1150112 RepID=A0A1I3MSQ8_9FLAO|nr:hypothetical protein SAMN04487893_102257 [Myroides guanonis]